MTLLEIPKLRETISSQIEQIFADFNRDSWQETKYIGLSAISHAGKVIERFNVVDRDVLSLVAELNLYSWGSLQMQPCHEALMVVEKTNPEFTESQNRLRLSVAHLAKLILDEGDESEAKTTKELDWVLNEARLSVSYLIEDRAGHSKALLALEQECFWQTNFLSATYGVSMDTARASGQTQFAAGDLGIRTRLSTLTEAKPADTVLDFG